MLLFLLDMMHPDVFPKYIVSLDVKCVVLNEVDIGNQFKNKQEFEIPDHMLQRIRMETSKLVGVDKFY